jgi:hypothetical protein
MYVCVCGLKWLPTVLRNMEVPGFIASLDIGRHDWANTSVEWVALLLGANEIPGSRPDV